MLRYLSFLLVLLACSDRPPTTPETRPVEYPNAGNTAIYDVDPDDPYEIDDSSFLEMQPGQPIAPFVDLRPGTLRTGDGELAVRYIPGRSNDTLGYVAAEGGLIDHIVIWSTDVVTKNGIRVGNTYGELVERLGQLAPYGSGVEARVYATHDGLTYRLGMNAPAGPLASVPDTVPIVEIILQ
ncbi:hypothetical protein LEM8419_02949 [Neolewinella maritima]|uniref:Uncharacterized protein n=1 Tax=Neolewinella maritima TaxID=1383882 RepID=A0ABM9B467_9BACT|nr:hypothetical protein [Neolewinella maritima]CAH1002034.1 hypothetical protein LEM8419_02949 [Neolewinella maritima]